VCVWGGGGGYRRAVQKKREGEEGERGGGADKMRGVVRHGGWCDQQRVYSWCRVDGVGSGGSGDSGGGCDSLSVWLLIVVVMVVATVEGGLMVLVYGV
jgi:hypothetical protein